MMKKLFSLLLSICLIFGMLPFGYAESTEELSTNQTEVVETAVVPESAPAEENQAAEQSAETQPAQVNSSETAQSDNLNTEETVVVQTEENQAISPVETEAAEDVTPIPVAGPQESELQTEFVLNDDYNILLNFKDYLGKTIKIFPGENGNSGSFSVLYKELVGPGSIELLEGSVSIYVEENSERIQVKLDEGSKAILNGTFDARLMDRDNAYYESHIKGKYEFLVEGYHLVIEKNANLTFAPNSNLKLVSAYTVPTKLTVYGTVDASKGKLSSAMRPLIEVDGGKILVSRNNLKLSKSWYGKNNFTATNGGAVIVARTSDNLNATEEKWFRDRQGVSPNGIDGTPVAVVGGVQYNWLDIALEAGANGEVITLLRDIEINGESGLTADTKINTNGFNVAASDIPTLKGTIQVTKDSNVSLDGKMYFGENGNLQLTSGTATIDFNEKSVILEGVATLPELKSGQVNKTVLLPELFKTAIIAKDAELTVDGVLKLASGSSKEGIDSVVFGKLTVSNSGTVEIAHHSKLTAKDGSVVTLDDLTFGECKGEAVFEKGSTLIALRKNGPEKIIGYDNDASMKIVEGSIDFDFRNKKEAVIKGTSEVPANKDTIVLPMWVDKAVVDAGSTLNVLGTFKLASGGAGADGKPEGADAVVKGHLYVAPTGTMVLGKYATISFENGSTGKIPATTFGTLKGQVEINHGATLELDKILETEKMVGATDDATINLKENSKITIDLRSTKNLTLQGNAVVPANKSLKVVPIFIQNVNVEENSTLTVDGNLRMADRTQLVLKGNAKLDVNGSLDLRSASKLVTSNNFALKGKLYVNNTPAEENPTSGLTIKLEENAQVYAINNLEDASVGPTTTIVDAQRKDINEKALNDAAIFKHLWTKKAAVQPVNPPVNPPVGPSGPSTPSTPSTPSVVTTPTGPAIIDIETEEIPLANIDFIDVLPTDWFYDAVRFAVGKDAMKGTGNKMFSPYMNTTRGMIATLIYQMNGSPDVEGEIMYPDVEVGKYYTNPVIYGTAQKVLKGYDNGNYGPLDLVTREQLVTILHRYAQLKGYDVSRSGEITSFADHNKVSAFALESVKFAVGSGIIKGNDKGMLNPKEPATRAELAMILMNFYNEVVK